MILDPLFHREGLVPPPIRNSKLLSAGDRVATAWRSCSGSAAQGAVSLGYVGGDTWEDAVQWFLMTR